MDINPARIRFSVVGDVGGGAITLKNKSRGAGTYLEVSEDVCSSFALRYLNLFNKASSLGSQVILSLSADLPLVMHFDFDIGEIKYYLAPKVSDD